MSNFLSYILKLSNWSPLFHFSNDDEFGSLSTNDWQRFSILSLSIGERKIYFLTLSKTSVNLKFNWLYYLQFSQICRIVSESEILHKTSDYETYLSNVNDEIKSQQIEFLKYKIELSNIRTTSSYEKTNMYSAIYTAYIAFEVFLLNQAIEYFSTNNSFVLKCALGVVLFGSIYYSINSGLFIYSSLKLKGFHRSTFKDLKQNHSLIKLSAAYYFDWFSLKNESDVITSIVSNIQKYFLRSFIASVITLTLTLTSFEPLKSPSQQKNEFLILNESGELLEEELLRFLNTKKNKPVSILLITNRDNNSRNAVINFLKLYSKNEIKIQSIEFNSLILKDQQVMLKIEE